MSESDRWITAILVLIIGIVASMIFYASFRYWEYHEALREQGVVSQWVEGHRELKRIEDVR